MPSRAMSAAPPAIHKSPPVKAGFRVRVQSLVLPCVSGSAGQLQSKYQLFKAKLGRNHNTAPELPRSPSQPCRPHSACSSANSDVPRKRLHAPWPRAVFCCAIRGPQRIRPWLNPSPLPVPLPPTTMTQVSRLSKARNRCRTAMMTTISNVITTKMAAGIERPMHMLDWLDERPPCPK